MKPMKEGRKPEYPGKKMTTSVTSELLGSL